jgi:hypothetical protein
MERNHFAAKDGSSGAEEGLAVFSDSSVLQQA